MKSSLNFATATNVVVTRATVLVAVASAAGAWRTFWARFFVSAPSILF